ncbi:hypothetical protein CDD82_2357 [Ophiocordyceps australis]|uniref:Uncharacterized protein n=1 Tax=Ophiocordyceps australis TaxID=1399860 RepID=A0A2C5XUX8_9HYPO|nr:hypothetical protein CDD82_2357 [Ophiocordyceps australis]
MGQQTPTPTPRRFLVAKRTAQQGSQTPGAQFPSTPRFGSLSVRRDTSIEDVDEDFGEGQSGADEARHDSLHDSIEVDLDEVGGSQSSGPDGQSGVAASSVGVGQAAKRRKLNTSPDSESSRAGRHQGGTATWEEGQVRRRLQDDVESSPLDSHDDVESWVGGHGSDGDVQRECRDERQSGRQIQQPVFHSPPRFKHADLALEAEDYICPDAVLTPRRRSGARYLPNGMASELQGWLSEIKAAGDEARGRLEGSRLRVEEVRAGSATCLALVSLGTEEQRCILAGAERLLGPGERTALEVGSEVIIGEPAWKVELAGQIWTVSCNWSVR